MASKRIAIIRPLGDQVTMIVEDLHATHAQQQYREVSEGALEEMFGWLVDCEIFEADTSIQDVADERIVHLVARFFEGGVQAFLVGYGF